MRRNPMDVPQVRIGQLPVGEEVDHLMSLKEVELAYHMSAAVISATGEITDSLLDAVHPDKR